MTRKKNIALFLLLLCQLLVIGYVYRPGRERGPATVTFFKNISPEQVVRLTIADDEANSIVLARDGQNWVIASQDDLPADTAKTEALVKKLVGLQSSRVVTQTKESHARLKVGDNFVRKITLEMQDGKTRNLILGTAPSYQTVHVRLGNDNTVYLVRNLSSWEVTAEPSSWWKSAYVDVAQDQLVKLSLANRNGQFTLTKDGETGKWQLADEVGGVVDQDKAQDFIDQVSRITVSEYLGKGEHPEYGLEKPAAQLTIATKDQTIRLRVGAAQNKKADFLVLKSSASPFYAKAGKYVVAPLLESKPEDLLAAGKQNEDKNS